MPKFDIASLERSFELLGTRVPKVVSPTVHAIADYVTATSFLVAGAFFRKKILQSAM